MLASGRFANDAVIPFWINGTEVVSQTTFDVLSPVTGDKLYACSTASSEHVQQVAEASQNAFQSWSATTPSTRRNIFLRCADIFERRAEELNSYCVSEIGASKMLVDFSNKTVVDALRAVAGDVYRIKSSIIPTEDETASMIVQRSPYGVVLAISSWNGPYPLGFRAILQPLIAGNTVILKGHEFCPAATWAIASAFKEAGLPDGCLNTIYHKAEDAASITELLISSPVVRKLNFTGSSATGRKIATVAAAYLKPCVLELGGKSPAIILEDADLQLAALQVALGAFFHAGQVCMSTERAIVAQPIADSFKAALQQAIEAVFPKQGGPMQMINARAAGNGRDLVADAISHGAEVIYGEAADSKSTAAIQSDGTVTMEDVPHTAPTPHPDQTSAGVDATIPANPVELNGGTPTPTTIDASQEALPAHALNVSTSSPLVLINVPSTSRLYDTESFAPSVSLYTVSSDEEAIALANDTQHGLAAAVFSKDLRRAMRIASKLDVGNVRINGSTIQGGLTTAHGGVKGSGWGVLCGEEGLAEWTRLKVVTYDH